MPTNKPLTRDTYTWYRRNPSHALKGMKGLTPEQRGVYGTIIDLCYDRRSPLANDDVEMARECGCDVRRYRRIKAELLAMERIVVDVEAGIIYDERAVRELVKAQLYSESQAKRARAPNKKSTKKSTTRAKAEKAPAVPRAKPEVLQNLQDLGQTVGPKSPPRSLKENDKTGANKEEKNKESSLEKIALERPPSPSIGGGRSLQRQNANLPPPAEDPTEREAMKAAALERLRASLESEGEGATP